MGSSHDVPRMMNAVPCALCGEDEAVPVATHDAFRIVRCRCCGLVYVNPRPASEEISSLYIDYHARAGGDERSWNRLMLGVFRESADLLAGNPNEREHGRILDIGCGYGGFIDLMRSRGRDAEGVDPSPAPVAAAAGKGLPVRLGTLDDLDLPKGYYSAVTMFYVLEHLPDPIGALRKVYDILSPGGMLLARVPHTTPIVRMLSPFGFGVSLYDAPYHLYDFSPSVLQRMLKEAGFVATRTFPGKPTRPSGFGPFTASVFFGEAARALYAVSGGRFLLPGVSKTTIARKPS